jgi:hypothetical protein
MTTISGQKRLDEAEVYLTPKEWAIRLVKEMRHYPCQGDFWRSAATREYRDWPWVLPFYRLSQQARAQYSGKRPENVDRCIECERKLRTEFQTLRSLIGRADEIIWKKAEKVTLKTALKVSTLQTLILKDTLSQTANNAAKNSEAKISADGNNRRILEKLRADTDAGLPSLIELLADDLAMLMEDIFQHQLSVELVQDRYFDGHPILFRDVEDNLMQAIKAVRDAVGIFNSYVTIRSELFEAGLGHEDDGNFAASGERTGHLIINIEKVRDRARLTDVDEWVKDSKQDAIVDILQETGEDKAYRWRIFRESLQR